MVSLRWWSCSLISFAHILLPTFDIDFLTKIILTSKPYGLQILISNRALVGIHENDTQKDLEYCAKRLLGCKLWENDAGSPWRHGAKTRGLEILCVSQFTLYGKLTKKNQPDYKASMKAIPAKAMYENFLELLRTQYEPDKIQDGVFGAMMDVGKCVS